MDCNYPAIFRIIVQFNGIVYSILCKHHPIYILCCISWLMWYKRFNQSVYMSSLYWNTWVSSWTTAVRENVVFEHMESNLLVKSLKHSRSLLWCLYSLGSLGISDRNTWATSRGPWREIQNMHWLETWLEMIYSLDHWPSHSLHWYLAVQ